MKYVPLAVTLLLGVVAGVLLGQLPCLTVQKTIDLDGLSSIFIGLTLFLGVNLVYQQQSMAKRGERDIMIKLCQDVLLASERLDSIFCRCYKEDPLSAQSIEEILGGIQRYNNAIHSLEVALKESQFKSKIDLKPIKDQREEYRSVLTESPFPIRYDSGTFRQQQRHQLAVREGCIRLSLAVNKL
jgi:hypothetical protein